LFKSQSRDITACVVLVYVISYDLEQQGFLVYSDTEKMQF